MSEHESKQVDWALSIQNAGQNWPDSLGFFESLVSWVSLELLKEVG
ncbi:MAG: hypothetical protein ABR962_06250 [Candidatus Bathyarchaeia archaeon]